jgi:citrate lyase beta subunit
MVPGDNPRFLRKTSKLKADYFVIDLEESVSQSNKLKALENLETYDVSSNTFVRIPFLEGVYNEEQITFLIKKFEGRIALPKVTDQTDVSKLVESYGDLLMLRLIILVENPQCFINLPAILKSYSRYIHGIGFGSHDFCANMGMKHSLEHLSFYRNRLILLSRAHGVDYIDGVDVNIRNLATFEEECLFAFNAGAEGKFLIHPDQLQRMYQLDYMTEKEMADYAAVHKLAQKINDQDIDIIEYNGQVYEKPHLARIDKLMHKLERRKG